MIINLSSKLVLPLMESTTVNLYNDSGKTITPGSNYSGFKSVNVEAVKLSNEVVEFGRTEYTVYPSGGADMIGSVTAKGIKAERLYGGLSEKEQVFTPTSPNVGFSSMQFYSPTDRSVIYAKPLPNDFTYTPTYSSDYGIGTLNLSAALLQEKTEEPKEEAFQVKPDSGYYGLSKVTIKGKTGYKAYERIYTGNAGDTYTVSNVPDAEFIKTPVQIIILRLDSGSTEQYKIFLECAFASTIDGYATSRTWSGHILTSLVTTQTTVSSYDYKTTNSNGFSFTIPRYNTSRVVLQQNVQYFIGIYGT